jgi:hypothetical protein
MMERENLAGLLEYLARSLVDKPDSVKVETYSDGPMAHLDLIVDTDDIGRVIGKTDASPTLCGCCCALWQPETASKLRWTLWISSRSNPKLE